MQTNRYGAEPGEWAQVFCNDIIAPWVLPVVSNTNVKISPKSSLSKPGKLPSVKNANGEIVGIKDWTTAPETTAENLNNWGRDTDLGFCVRTGHNGLIAIDCDVNDQQLSDTVKNLFCSTCKIKPEDLSVRTRGGARWATLAQLSGREELQKKIIELDGADKPTVEILGKGQQLVCAGMHPSGQRYSWSQGIQVISIDSADFNTFCTALLAFYGADQIDLKETAPRMKGKTFKAPDRLADWLLQTNRVIKSGAQGELYIVCPWCDQHTTHSGDQETAYFPIGSNGYAQGGFKCLHAHCANRTLDDFRQWAKSQGFTETTPAEYPDETQNTTNIAPGQSEAELLAKARAALSEWFIETTFKYTPTADSVTTAMRYPVVCGPAIAYDTFTNAILMNDGAAWRPYEDDDVTKIRITLERFGFVSTKLKKELIKDAISLIAKENSFDLMRNYLDNNVPKWDGVERAKLFFSRYCGAEDTPYSRACGQYLFSALWGRAHSLTPVKADIAIVLIGPQGARKSTLVEKLAINADWYTAIDFESKDADNVRNIQGKITAELPELSGMNKRDIAAVKAFLSKASDTWVKKYQEQSTTAARRCVFLMTTNETEFLTDRTGNRRYAPIETGDKILIEEVETDLMQLWAEGRELFNKNGVMHRQVEELNGDALQAHIETDPWEAKVQDWIEIQASSYEGYPLTTCNILSYALGIDIARQRGADVRHVAEIMRKLGYPKNKNTKIGKNVRRVWSKD